MSVVVIMLVGKKPEPFLSACLESLYGCVDIVLINDNSELASHYNLDQIKQSRLYHEGAIRVLPSKFIGFGPCRNICLKALQELQLDDPWIFIVDSDEIHENVRIKAITQSILPNLPKEIGIVDGYFFDFFQTANYYQAFNHRHNMIFRYHPEIHWTQDVHEKLVNLRGKRLVLPYIFFHYGYIKSINSIQEKWRLYGELGDVISGKQAESVHETIASVASTVWYFPYCHSTIVLPIFEHLIQTDFVANEVFEAMVRRQKLIKIRSWAKRMQIELKMKYLYGKAFIQLGRQASILRALLEQKC